MPAPTLNYGATTAYTASVVVSNLAADGTLDVQYAARPDFRFCVAPLVKGVARGNFTVGGLQSGSNWYVRARSRRNSGAVEDWSNILAVRTAAGPARDLTPAAVMIEPAILVVPTPVLSWTDINASTVAGYPLQNLGFDGPVAWTSKNASSDVHVFAAELGPTPIDTIALLSSNANQNASVNIRAGSTTAGNDYAYGPVTFHASPALPARPGYHALIRLPAPQTHRYWRVEITSANFERQFHLEHAVFGLNRSTKNHSVDKVEAGVDLGSLERDRAGNPIRLLGAKLRRVDFDISVMTEAQYEANYADLDWRVGQTQPVLCVPNSKSGAFLHDRILYGAIRGGRVVNPASPRYTRGFTIESII